MGVEGVGVGGGSASDDGVAPAGNADVVEVDPFLVGRYIHPG